MKVTYDDIWAFDEKYSAQDLIFFKTHKEPQGDDARKVLEGIFAYMNANAHRIKDESATIEQVVDESMKKFPQVAPSRHFHFLAKHIGMPAHKEPRFIYDD